MMPIFRATLIPVLLLVPIFAQANVTLPAVFSDHAVLQKSEKVPVWGKATADEKVTVTLDKATASTTTGADGKWKVELNLKSEGQGPYDLVIEGANKVTVKDVVVGEVWVCSGQSNMELSMTKAFGVEAEIALPANPLLRQFHAAYIALPTPQDDVAGKWEIASPETVKNFTAVGYFFGKKLQTELQVPVGLIHTSWGGTPSEAWTSAEGMDTVPDLKAGKDKAIGEYLSFQDYSEKYSAWAEKYNRKEHPLPSSLDPYIKADASPTEWKTVKLPAKFADVGLPDAGAVWLRKKITLPPELLKQGLAFKFGDHHDNLTLFWNGKSMGQRERSTLGQTYWVDASHSQTAENILLIRISNSSTGMGFLPGKIAFTISDKVHLDGEWLAKVEYELPPLDGEAKASLPPLPSTPMVNLSKQNIATFLFNGMIHPLIPYSIAGAIWYQGEANAGRAFQYRTAFPLMITDWRKQWGQGDFPFYFCQLANYQAHAPVPKDSAWAELREAQTMTLTLPNTGQAILIDTGDESDIHPRNKKDPGERLALHALAKTYGKQIPYSGPMYDSNQIEGDKIRVKFKNTDGGLVAKPLPATYVPRSYEPEKTAPLVRNTPESEVEGFAICGEDHKWVWANAKIDGNDILVSAPSVTKPVAVRYAWADNPFCNLYNGAGLPACPFRTDSFPGVTEKSKY